MTENRKEEIKKEMEKRVREQSRYHYHKAVELFNTYSFIRDEWYHFPEQHFIKDRFVKKVVLEQCSEEFPIPPAEVPTGKNDCGLYLVGQTTFNPFTREEFYFVKVGKSDSSLGRRMKNYGTHNPALWRIDFKTIQNAKTTRSQEKLYQFALEEIGNNSLAENSREWFAVSREQYLKICDRGFKYLDTLVKIL